MTFVGGLGASRRVIFGAQLSENSHSEGPPGDRQSVARFIMVPAGSDSAPSAPRV